MKLMAKLLLFIRAIPWMAIFRALCAWAAGVPRELMTWFRSIEWKQLSRTLVFRALVFSVVFHIAAFGSVKWGKAHGWFHPHPLPAWMNFIQQQLRRNALNKPPAPQPKPIQLPRELPVTFVDVDPSLASATPPKDKKFYGAANTLAASPVKKDSDLPQITGQQDKVLKTTDPTPPKPQTLQPSPKPEPKPEVKPEVKPQPDPMQSQVPGDLAMTSPQDKARTGKADKPETKPAPATRPRTVEEAMRKHGMQADKMKQEGGSARVAMDSTLDVTRTAAGDYDREFVDAVQQRWNKLLEDRTGTTPGKVIVGFRLHYDGRITDVKITYNDVGELLSLLCRKAIEDPAPYKRWPMEMRREINADFRDIKFTFYYLNP